MAVCAAGHVIFLGFALAKRAARVYREGNGACSNVNKAFYECPPLQRKAQAAAIIDYESTRVIDPTKCTHLIRRCPSPTSQMVTGCIFFCNVTAPYSSVQSKKRQSQMVFLINWTHKHCNWLDVTAA